MALIGRRRTELLLAFSLGIGCVRAFSSRIAFSTFSSPMPSSVLHPADSAPRSVGAVRRSVASLPRSSDNDAARSYSSNFQGSSSSKDLPLASIALVAGNALGAGVLALPSVSLPSGFVVSSIALGFTWAGCVATALLVAEVMINVQRAAGHSATASSSSSDNDQQPAGIYAIAEKTLGEVGGAVACATYILLNYSLLVAYVSKGGGILSEAASTIGAYAAASASTSSGGVELDSFTSDNSFGLSVGYTALIATLTLRSSPAGRSALQGVLLASLLATFWALLAALLPSVKLDLLLAHADVEALPAALPVLVCALVFHNVVPTVVQQERADPGRVRTSIVAGSLLPLSMYIVFNLAFLGSVPFDALDGAGELASFGQYVSNCLGSHASAADGGAPARLAAELLLPVFSLTALTSSLMGTARSQVEEISALIERRPSPVGADPNPVGKAAANYLATFSPTCAAPAPATTATARRRIEDVSEDVLGCAAVKACLIFAPPLAVSFVFPDVFETALEFGGTYGDLVLFGLIPVAMSWSQRFGSSSSSNNYSSGVGTTSDNPLTLDPFSGGGGGGWSSQSAVLASSVAARAWSEHSAAVRANLSLQRRQGAGADSLNAVIGAAQTEYGDECEARYNDYGDSAAAVEAAAAAVTAATMPVELVPGGRAALLTLGGTSAALIASYSASLL
jgi:tyrosine-specific transport protein